MRLAINIGIVQTWRALHTVILKQPSNTTYVQQCSWFSFFSVFKIPLFSSHSLYWFSFQVFKQRRTNLWWEFSTLVCLRKIEKYSCVNISWRRNWDDWTTMSRSMVKFGRQTISHHCFHITADSRYALTKDNKGIICQYDIKFWPNPKV